MSSFLLVFKKATYEISDNSIIPRLNIFWNFMENKTNKENEVFYKTFKKHCVVSCTIQN